MKFLKWFASLAALLLFVAFVGAWLYAQFYLEPYLKRTIEEKGTEALATPLSVDSVSVGLLPPFRITLNHVRAQLSKPTASVDLQTVTVRAHLGLGVLSPGANLGRFDIIVDKPTISVILPRETENAQAEAPAIPPTSQGESGENPFDTIPRDFEAKLDIRDATLDISFASPHPEEKSASQTDQATETSKDAEQFRAVRLSPLDLTLLVSGKSAPLTLKLDTTAAVSWDGLRLRLPIKSESRFTYDGKRIQVANSRGDLAGLIFDAQGSQSLTAPASGQWSLKIDIADIGKLPVPPSFLPNGTFSGKVRALLNASQVEGRPWNATGSMTVERFRGESVFSADAARAAGVVTADLAAEMTYSGKSVEATAPADIRLPKLQARINLDDAEITYAKTFNKPRGIPLNLYVDAIGDPNELTIRDTRLAFAGMNARAQGRVAMPGAEGPGASSNLRVEISRTSLTGWERYFPPLAQAPVRGFVELKGSLSGDLQQPEKLEIELAPLELREVQGRVQWTSEDRTKSVSGPIDIDTRAHLKVKGQNLIGAVIDARADLTRAAIRMNDTFVKRANQPLRMNLKAEKRGEVLELRPSSLDLGSSRVSLSGSVRELQRPKLGLKFSAPKLVLTEWSEMLPSMREILPSGTAAVNGELDGTFDFQLGMQKSPLRAKLDVKADIPKYAYKAQPTPATSLATKSTASGPGAPLEPLLPDWPVLRNSEFKTDIRVVSLQFNELPIQNIHATNTISRGVLAGSVRVGKIFGGEILLSDLRTDLKQTQPDIALQTRFRTIDANAAMTWISKDWKDLVKGSASGQVSANLAHPSRPDFVERAKAAGDVTITNAFVSTMQLDQLANDALARIPGLSATALGGNKINSKGVAADARLAFEWSNNQAQIKNFVFLTPENNQISASGTVNLNKNIHLTGTAFLATAPVKGSVREANSDAAGRFMIPIEIKGNLLRPQASFAQASVEGVLKNTANLEIKKAQGKLNERLEQEKKKVEKKAQDEVKKLGEKLKQEGLKGLFK